MTTPKNGITQAHHGWPREEAPTNGASGPLRNGPTCGACNLLLVETADGYRCLNCKAEFRRKAPQLSREYVTPEQFNAEMADDTHRRQMARAVGLSPEEPWEVIAAKAQRIRDEHRKYQEAAAAFDACLKGLPSHVAVRPVCRAPLCDNLPRTNGLCNKHYPEGDGHAK